MRSVLILFASLGFGTACAEQQRLGPTPRAPRDMPSAAVPVPVSVRSCRAQPETVYGDEQPLFSVEGAPSGAEAALSLFDEAGSVVARGLLKMPGEWRAPTLPSGDFRLEAGTNRVTCFVTVNRELSRASEARR